MRPCHIERYGLNYSGTKGFLVLMDKHFAESLRYEHINPHVQLNESLQTEADLDPKLILCNSFGRKQSCLNVSVITVLKVLKAFLTLSYTYKLTHAHLSNIRLSISTMSPLLVSLTSPRPFIVTVLSTQWTKLGGSQNTPTRARFRNMICPHYCRCGGL